ncbi:hypothetical protein HG263_04535 [Pseudoalteromonas sp. JBTF-M23]|uniref:WD40 repeat protein n=1 Tax=Pseudoalteromonas caenipelagi TaxID=2726988 RepID=A0A849VDM5_9GAMM|nr:PD40 domain-containing protein [Pseudoalteromonas caenipelagi]NOU49801.1 hypothetical protein [Pseudoalteromonas caenipelagi]
MIGRVFILGAVFVSGVSVSMITSQACDKPYFCQQPPKLTPLVFAPGIVSTKHRDHSISFTSDLKEAYISRRNVDTGKWWLMQFKVEDGGWTESTIGPRVGRPILSPDGQTMHLGNKYMTRTDEGWSEVKSLGATFARSDWGIMRFSSSKSGTYVFDDYKNNDVLRISTLNNGLREKPQLLAPHINSGMWTAHPFIAQDGSYLIWDSEKEEGYGDKDLYISFRQQDGAWGPAINMGEKVNTDKIETGAYVSPDGNYLFFNRGPTEKMKGIEPESNIYWVDTQVLWDLKDK